MPTPGATIPGGNGAVNDLDEALTALRSDSQLRRYCEVIGSIRDQLEG